MMVSDIKLRGVNQLLTETKGVLHSPAPEPDKYIQITTKKYICKNKARTSKFDFTNQCCRCQGHVFFLQMMLLYFLAAHRDLIG